MIIYILVGSLFLLSVLLHAFYLLNSPCMFLFQPRLLQEGINGSALAQYKESR